MANCQSEDIRDQWEMLAGDKKANAYIAMMQSTANRLFEFVAERGVQRILMNPHPINLKEITANAHTLIVNLNKSDIFPIPSRNVIGTFLVDEIWDIVSSRSREQVERTPHFNFMVDEFQHFATPEFAEMLKEGAKYNLHLWLINHTLEDLEPSVRRALNACHTRIALGGTSQKDAATVLEGSRPEQGYDLRDEIAAVSGFSKRRVIIRRTGKNNLVCWTPDVRHFPVSAAKKEAYLDHVARVSPAPQPEVRPISPPQNRQKEAPRDTPRENVSKPEAIEPDDFYH